MGLGAEGVVCFYCSVLRNFIVRFCDCGTRAFDLVDGVLHQGKVLIHNPYVKSMLPMWDQHSARSVGKCL